MEILVLGGTRLMGKQLVKTLLEQGHSVTIATRGNVKDDFGGRVTRILVDRGDKAGLQGAFSGKRYDVVYDNLAYCSNDVRNLLEAVACNKYIVTSTGSVYAKWHLGLAESEVDTRTLPLVWSERDDSKYGEMKTGVECAALQQYGHLQPIAVRFPFIIGEDDYTERFYFYVKHIVGQQPMECGETNARISFILAQTAGRFMAHLATSDFSGSVNISNVGTLSVADIFKLTLERTGQTPILQEGADKGPYTGAVDFSYDLTVAHSLGFEPEALHDTIGPLMDYYVQKAQQE